MELLINIDVPDVEQAASFYTRATGLRVGRRLFEGTVIELLGAPSPIYLVAKDADTCIAPHASPTRNYSRHWTPLHLDFIVSDIDAAVARAIEAGAILEGAPAGSRWTTFPWGHLATFSDPFGNGFCFVQWQGAG